MLQYIYTLFLTDITLNSTICRLSFVFSTDYQIEVTRFFINFAKTKITNQPNYENNGITFFSSDFYDLLMF